MEDRVPFNLWMEPELKEVLEDVARLEDRSISAVIRQACRVYVMARRNGDEPEVTVEAAA